MSSCSLLPNRACVVVVPSPSHALLSLLSMSGDASQAFGIPVSSLFAVVSSAFALFS